VKTYRPALAALVVNVDLYNRMKTASRTGTSATLGYDPEGRMVRTTVNGAETNLLYDGQ